jgi:hypothetical protein
MNYSSVGFASLVALLGCTSTPVTTGDDPCGTVPSGTEQMRTRFESATAAAGTECVSEVQMRTCRDGTYTSWTGTFAAEACMVLTPGACGSVPDGGSETRPCYAAASVPFGETCAATQQMRTCMGGVWSPDYAACTNTSCSIEPSGEPLFFDDFEYDVPREATDKWGADGRFTAHGWSSLGKDGSSDGAYVGGWLYTATSIPGYTGAFPGGGDRVLVVESRAGTMAGFADPAINWRQTDFYLQYGEENGPTDTIPPDIWLQHWMYIADAAPQNSLFPPTTRLGKWFYPTRASYGASHLRDELAWLVNFTGVMVDSERIEEGASATVDIGFTSIAPMIALTDADSDIYTDARADSLYSLGHSGTDPERLTPISANRWFLLRAHFDNSVNPGVAEMWIRQSGGEWIKIVDSIGSPVVDWETRSPEGHCAMRIPTTISNWYQNPEPTTHGDWWIYLDDFAMAVGEHSGGGGMADLPAYP